MVTKGNNLVFVMLMYSKTEVPRVPNMWCIKHVGIKDNAFCNLNYETALVLLLGPAHIDGNSIICKQALELFPP